MLRGRSSSSMRDFARALGEDELLLPEQEEHCEICDAIDDDTILRAAVLCEDTLATRKPEHLMDVESIKFYRFYNRRSTKWVIRIFVMINLLLALFEEPSHIRLQRLATTAVELFCLTVFLAQVWAKFRFLKRGRLFKDKKNVIQIIVISLNLLDLFIWVIMQFYNEHGAFRFTRILRPWYLVYTHKSIRLALRDIRKTLREIFDVMMLVLFVLLFYSVVCTILFSDFPGAEGTFGDPIKTFVSLYALMTTVNFPDVMMPMYSANGFWSLVFISFLVIALYLLMNLVLAVVYNSYRTHFKSEVKGITLLRWKLLQDAFHLLDRGHPGTVHFTVWQRLMRIIRPKMTRERVAIFFHMLDEDNDGALTAADLRHMPEMFDLKLVRIDPPYNITLAKCIPRVYEHPITRRLRRWVVHPAFGYFMDFVIVLNGIMIILEFYLTKQSDIPTDEAFYIEISFTCLFVIELLLKVFTLGARGYWRETWNRFDAFIVVCAVLNLIIDSVTNLDLGQVSRFFLMGRVLRLVRLVYKLKRFRVILRSLSTLSPVMSTYVCVMLVTYHVFAIVGMEVWGGAIYRENPLLEGTAYAAANYYANNFNSLPEAFVVLFELMVVNNWHIIADGFVAISGPAAYIYFIVFNMISSILIMNIIVAFVLEVFQTQFELEELRRNREDPVVARLDMLASQGIVRVGWKLVAKPLRGFNVMHKVFSEEVEAEIFQEKEEGRRLQLVDEEAKALIDALE